MGKYRVIRHHEIVVDAIDHEAAMQTGVGMTPYETRVELLDREAVLEYRRKLLDEADMQQAKMNRITEEILRTDQELREMPRG